MTRSYGERSVAASLLKLARVKAGLSQTKLASRAAVPATMISAYERGQRQPTLPTLIRLLDAAGFELRLHLEVSDPHDAVLAELEAQRDPTEREARDRQQDAWRRAVDLGPIATVKP